LSDDPWNGTAWDILMIGMSYGYGYGYGYGIMSDEQIGSNNEELLLCCYIVYMTSKVPNYS